MGQPSTACIDWRYAQATDSRNWIENPHVDLSDPDSWLDTTLCIRWLLYNSGDKVEADGYVLRYRVNGGSWVAVTTTSDYVRAVDHPYRTDGQATSQELGSGTYDEGYWDDNGVIAEFNLANGQESENEHSFQFLSDDCAGTTIELQLAFDTPLDLDGYTYSHPSSTFTAAAADQPYGNRRVARNTLLRM